MEKIIPESIGIKQTVNYKLLLLKGILHPNEVHELFQLALKVVNTHKQDILNKDYFIRPNGTLAENAPLFPLEEDQNIFHDYCVKIRERLSSSLITNTFPILIGKNGKEYQWNVILTLSSGKNLEPHTDDLGKAAEDAKEFTHPLTSGIYKGLVYLGDISKNYANYGTCFYKPWDEHQDRDLPYKWYYTTKLKKDFEIPFIPGNGFLFGTNPHSYHGTDYGANGIQDRVTLTLEYCEQG